MNWWVIVEISAIGGFEEKKKTYKMLMFTQDTTFIFTAEVLLCNATNYYMLLYTTICYYILLYVTMYYYMLLWIAICYYICYYTYITMYVY